MKTKDYLFVPMFAICIFFTIICTKKIIDAMDSLWPLYPDYQDKPAISDFWIGIAVAVVFHIMKRLIVTVSQPIIFPLIIEKH